MAQRKGRYLKARICSPTQPGYREQGSPVSPEAADTSNLEERIDHAADLLAPSELHPNCRIKLQRSVTRQNVQLHIVRIQIYQFHVIKHEGPTMNQVDCHVL